MSRCFCVCVRACVRACVCICTCTYVTHLYLQGETSDDGCVELSQCLFKGLSHSSVMATLEGTHLRTYNGGGVEGRVERVGVGGRGSRVGGVGGYVYVCIGTYVRTYVHTSNNTHIRTYTRMYICYNTLVCTYIGWGDSLLSLNT